MKLVIVGGVAGGASAAARARRMDETAEIVLLERGEFISFANCGLPYHVGQVIPSRDDLLVMSPDGFRRRTAVDVRTQHEVTAIRRDRKCLEVRDLRTGRAYEEPYDKLILSTGSTPIRPDLPGIDDPDILPLWTIPDMDRIKHRVDEGAKRAVVVGAGFIGLEVAENLRHRGVEVTVVELLPQVLPTLDPEMARILAGELRRNGVQLLLGRKVTGFARARRDADPTASPLSVTLDDGSTLPADVVVLAVGVRPNSGLAREAGLTVGQRGGVVVDDHLRTSDPDILAVGDMVEVRDWVTGTPTQTPLAGPANRQGRTAADNACGRDSLYRGTQGTAIVKVFGLAAASVGRTERSLRAEKIAFRKVYTHPASHASYYPGAKPLSMKLLFQDDGKMLGAQIVGADGVDKRIDVLATAMRAGLTVYGLEELELAYAPPYGSAKDPVNFLGMVAANVLRGDSEPAYPDEIPPGALLLDVREKAERDLGTIPDSAFIPLGQLRQRAGDLPRDRQIVAFCKVGLRGYLAERILRRHGLACANLSGGYTTWKLFHPDPVAPPAAEPDRPAPAPAAPTGTPPAPAPAPTATRQVSLCGLQCPGPIIRLRQEMDAIAPGQVLAVRADDAFRPDLETWCRCGGHEILALTAAAGGLQALLRKGQPTACSAVASAQTPNSAAIVVFSGDLDRALAALIIANGFAALGSKVTLFFTFWGLNILRRDSPPPVRKDFLSRMFGLMMPRGARKLALSKLDMLGAGTAMMKHVMASKGVPSLPELITQAHRQGVRFVACDMAMNVMGLQRSELLDEVDEMVGVASFAGLARDSGTTLFI